MKTNVTARTRVNKHEKTQKITSVVLDWTGCTMDDLIEPATDSIVIAVQNQWRRAKLVPQTMEINVKQFVSTIGSRNVPVTVDGIAAASKTLKLEEQDALIAKLIAERKLAAANAKKAA